MSRIRLADFESDAREKLEPVAWDYFASGADDEITLRENRAAFERWTLHYRVMAGTTARRLATTVLGQTVSLPVLLAPTAFQRLAHPDGEAATARAAAASRTIMVLSTLGTTPVEEVAAAGPSWFQLYLYRDRGVTRALVDRVASAGCTALVLTVDAPVLGRRERDVRNRFGLPPGLRAENLVASGLGDVPGAASGSGLASYFASLLDPALGWEDLAWLRSITSLPVLVKGIVRPDDALRALEHGAAGVIVSNHGGRQLDGAPATIDVLPAVVDVVAGRSEVLVDGGVRRGTDVLKALALGARAVLIGRPVLWGLAVDGQAGVEAVIELLRSELDRALALSGSGDVTAVSRDLVGPARPPR